MEAKPPNKGQYPPGPESPLFGGSTVCVCLLPPGDTASNLGIAMDELMRHQPTLRSSVITALIRVRAIILLFPLESQVSSKFMETCVCKTHHGEGETFKDSFIGYQRTYLTQPCWGFLRHSTTSNMLPKNRTFRNQSKLNSQVIYNII